MVEVILLQLQDLTGQSLSEVDHRTTAEGIEVYSISEVFADRDIGVDSLGFAQAHLTHFVDEIFIRDDMAGTPDLEVALLIQVDDDGEGIV